MASQIPHHYPTLVLTSPHTTSRDEVVSEIKSFYASLPHVEPPLIHLAPPGAWEVITVQNPAKHALHKTDEAVLLLRQLPYIDGDQPWIMTTALSCSY